MRARVQRGPWVPHMLFRGMAEAALYCAHRTSTVSPCAFCEQEGHLDTLHLLIHANNFDSQAFVLGVKCSLRHRFTTFLFTSACVG